MKGSSTYFTHNRSNRFNLVMLHMTYDTFQQTHEEAAAANWLLGASQKHAHLAFAGAKSTLVSP